MTSSGYPFRTCNAPCRIGNRQREREKKKKKKKNHSDCIQLGSQLTRCATSSRLRLQKCSVGGTTTDLEYPNTQYNDWGRPSVGHLDNCRDRPERFWGLVVFMEWADRSRSLWRHAFFQPGLTAMAICTFQRSFQFQINFFTLLSCTVPGVYQWGTPESILDKTMISGLATCTIDNWTRLCTLLFRETRGRWKKLHQQPAVGAIFFNALLGNPVHGVHCHCSPYVTVKTNAGDCACSSSIRSKQNQRKLQRDMSQCMPFTQSQQRMLSYPCSASCSRNRGGLFSRWLESLSCWSCRLGNSYAELLPSWTFRTACVTNDLRQPMTVSAYLLYSPELRTMWTSLVSFGDQQQGSIAGAPALELELWHKSSGINLQYVPSSSLSACLQTRTIALQLFIGEIMHYFHNSWGSGGAGAIER